jgi:hypothetical protein
VDVRVHDQAVYKANPFRKKKIIFYTTPSLFFSLTDLSLFFFTQEHSTIFQIPAGGRQARLRRHRAETPKHPKNQSF